MSEIKFDRFSTINLRKIHNIIKSIIVPHLNSTSSVLDAGCGYKNFLIGKNNVKLLVGIDLNENAIKNNKNLSFGVKARLEEISFQKQKFDVVFSHNVIEHVENPEKFFWEVSKILKSGGYFFFTTPNKLSIFGILVSSLPLDWLKLAYMKLYRKKMRNEVHYYRMNRVDNIVKCLKKCNFDKLHIVLLNYLPDNKWMRKLQYLDYLIGKSGIIKDYSVKIVCLARRS